MRPESLSISIFHYPGLDYWEFLGFLLVPSGMMAFVRVKVLGQSSHQKFPKIRRVLINFNFLCQNFSSILKIMKGRWLKGKGRTNN